MKRGMTNYEQIFDRLGGIDAKLDGIFEQTKKTNGRVTKLEERMDQVDETISYAKGFSKGRMVILAALAFLLGSILVPIIAAYIQGGKI